jgi:hypothetical protein
VAAFAWEGNVAKALCHQAGAAPRTVALLLQSKASHALDLAPGRRLAVHPPWHEVEVPGPGPPVVLAHLVSQLPGFDEVTQRAPGG